MFFPIIIKLKITIELACTRKSVQNKHIKVKLTFYLSMLF